MKRWMSMVLVIVMLLGLMTGTASAAANTPTFVSVVLDGEKIWFPDAQAFVDENSRTLVPVRFVAEKMNAKVGWDPKMSTVPIKRDKQTIRLTIGESKAIVNGDEVSFDTKAIMSGGRTFVPLRFVSEVLGAEVKWDSATSTVFITTKSTSNENFDKWGRQIRTTNLPKNAADYPYILADVSNNMYEMIYPFSHPDVDERSVSSKMFAEVPEFTKENIDIWMSRLKDFGALWLNVDYRTIDDQWASHLSSYQTSGNLGNQAQAKEYVKWVKKNKIIIEGYLDPEPSMIYQDGFGAYYVRSKFRIKFNSFTKNEKLLLDSWFSDYSIVKGRWIEGYSDIALSTNVGGNWGQTLKLSGNVSIFRNFILVERG